MKWFKHYSTASDSRNVNHLIDEFGIQGYAWWFLLLELCAEKYDGIGEPEFTFHRRVVQLKLRSTWTRVQLLLDSCSTRGQLAWTAVGQEINIKIPKLLEIRDNHVRNLQASFPTVGPRTRVDKEQDKIKIKIKKGTVQTPPPMASGNVTELKNVFLESYRTEFKRDYPGWGSKEASQAKLWLRSISLDNAKRLCELYPKWNDPWVTKVGHPFGVLVKQYVQLDAWAGSSKHLIQKIARGRAIENVDIKRAVDFQEMKHGMQHTLKRQAEIAGIGDLGRVQNEVPSITTERVSGQPGDPFSTEIFEHGDQEDLG